MEDTSLAIICGLIGGFFGFGVTMIVQSLLSRRESVIGNRTLRKMRLDSEDKEVANAFCIANKEKRIENAKVKQRENLVLLKDREARCKDKMSELNASRRKLQRILEEIDEQETPGQKNLKIKVDLGAHLPIMAEIVSSYASVIEQYILKYATDSFWDAVSTGDSKQRVINNLTEHKNTQAEKINNFGDALKQAEDDLTLGVEQLERSLELWSKSGN